MRREARCTCRIASARARHAARRGRCCGKATHKHGARELNCVRGSCISACVKQRREAAGFVRKYCSLAGLLGGVRCVVGVLPCDAGADPVLSPEQRGGVVAADLKPVGQTILMYILAPPKTQAQSFSMILLLTSRTPAGSRCRTAQGRRSASRSCSCWRRCKCPVRRPLATSWSPERTPASGATLQ